MNTVSITRIHLYSVVQDGKQQANHVGFIFPTIDNYNANGILTQISPWKN